MIAEKAIRRSHEIRHHILIPHSHATLETPEFSVEYHINGDGFRDDELTTRRNGEVRIAVLGDSFTEGFGVAVESCYVQLLERLLNRKGSSETFFNVVNCGVVSYSPLLQVIQLKAQVLAISPDVVIIAFDMSDLDDDRGYAEEATFTESGEPISARNTYRLSDRWSLLPHGPLRTFARDNSYIFALFNTAMLRLSTPEIRGERLKHTVERDVGERRQDLERSFAYLRILNRLCSERGILFRLITYPYGHQASASEWLKGRAEYDIGPGRYDSFIFEKLEAFAVKEGIPYLDMTPAFRRSGVGQLYFAFDGHWTTRGHAVVADTLARFLRATGIQ